MTWKYFIPYYIPFASDEVAENILYHDHMLGMEFPS